VPSTAKEPTLKQPLLVRSLKVTAGTVTYAPPPPNGELILRDVALDGPVGFEGVLQVASSGGLWNRAQPLQFIPTQARLKASSKLEVEVESFEGGTPLTRVKLSGPLGRVGVLHPDLKLDVDLGLRDLRQIEALPAMDGRVALAGFGGQSQTDVTFEGSRLQGRVRFSGVDSRKLARQGVNLGVPFSGALSGDVSGSGDLRSGIDVRATLAADGQAFTDYGLKA